MDFVAHAFGVGVTDARLVVLSDARRCGSFRRFEETLFRSFCWAAAFVLASGWITDILENETAKTTGVCEEKRTQPLRDSCL